MSYSILSDPPVTTPLQYYVNQPFDVSFGSTFTLYPSSIQFTDSTSALLSNTFSNRFISATGFTTKGTIGNLVVDAISLISPVASTIQNKIATNSSYQGIAISNNTIYFSDTNNNKIYTCDLNGGSLTLFAGTGTAGYTNGFRTSATFTAPLDLDFDSVGNLYVAEVYDIRKIDTAGNVTTIAGSNVQGAVNGIGTAARFRTLPALTIDPNDDNTLYVIDQDAHCVRKIDLPTSNVTTYAGQLDSAGFVDNTGLTSARFNFPGGIAIRKDTGDIYVSDSYNHRIRKLSGGFVSTYAGNGTNSDSDGTLTSGSFSFPYSITYDSNTSSFYVFQEAQTIKKVSSTSISKYIGKTGVYSSIDGNSTVATFDRITQLTSYNGNLYAPQVSGVLRKIVIPATVTDARPSGTRPSGYTIVATSNISVQSLSRIDASTNAIGGTFQFNTYAGFNGNIYSALTSNTSLQYTNSSIELLAFLSNIDTSTVSFSSTGGFRQSYSLPLSLVVNAISNSTTVDTLSNSVIVNAAGFDTGGITSFTFYRNEPIGQYPFTASLPIRQPLIVSPSLPPQLTFTQQDASGTLFFLSGTPLTQTTNTSYRLIGKGLVDAARIITSTINIQVLGERLLLDICGSSNVSLTTTTAISNRTVTARAPPYPLQPNRITYSWFPALPDGLNFLDFNSNIKSSPFLAQDTNSTIILSGTPTSNAAINSPTKTISTTLVATRNVAPNISNSITFSFTFSEHVLFRTPNVQSTFYNGAAVTSSTSSNSFSAFTKFATTDSSITAMWSPDLRSDLSLNFVFNDQRAYLTGTPLSTGSGTFSVYASNANSIIGNTSPFTISVLNDTISFTPPTDTCYNFIVSRDLTNAKTGYYTSPIDYKASSASGCNFVVSTNDLSGTGLSLSNLGSNTYRVSGIPTSTKSLSTLTIDASSLVTSASGVNTAVKFLIVPDTFTFVNTSFTFIENKQITPYQFSATTLSERPVVGYSSSNLPSGLSISGAGLLSGTPLSTTSGSFDIVATTGYASSSKNYSYTLIPDTMVLITNPLSYRYPAGSNVDIQITGLTYSGKTVSNYAFSNFTPSYGLSIGSVSGNITGTLTDSIPPNLILPSSCNFQITAKAGLLDGSLSSTLTTTNPVENRAYMLWFNKDLSNFSVYYSSNDYRNWNSAFFNSNLASEQGCGTFIKNTSIDSNVFLVPTTLGGSIIRSTDGVNFRLSSNVPSSTYISYVVNKPNTTTWWGIGNVGKSQSELFLFKSTDDGDTWIADISINPMSDTSNWQGREGAVNTVNYYTYYGGGGTIAYNNGILMIGGGRWGLSAGHSMARSSNEGATWNNVTGEFLKEVGYYSLDVSSMWIVTGSDQYTTHNPGTTPVANNTIKYSTDEGLNWSNATGGFTMNGYDVLYGNGNWLAVGKDIQVSGYLPSLRWSSNGTSWLTVDLSSDTLFTPITGSSLPPYKIGPISFDGDKWNVFVIPDFLNTFCRIYTHDISTSLSSNWSVIDVSSSFSDINTQVYGMTRRQYVKTGTPILANFSFNSLLPNGPVFTAPTQTSYIFYQYMKLTPITFNATGTGRVYYMVDSNDLPVGITFDPINQTITGASMRLGENSITIYAKDDIGVTRLVLNTNTIIARIIKNQSGAGAYTSLIRQYTEVNAADNARNNRTLPTQNKNLGEFQSPYKSDVISVEPCPKC